MGMAVYGMARYGVAGVFLVFPRFSWDGIFLVSAAFLLIITDTDYPETIRKSRLIRSQVRCWAIWQLLLVFLFLLASHRLPADLVAYLVSAMIMLTLYSSGVILRATVFGRE